MNEEKKKWWQSKTMWVNLLLAIAGLFMKLFPESGLDSIMNESNLILIISVINLILRATTKKAIE